MRLLFLSHRYWPATGGVESFLRHVTRELSTRHEVTVLTQRIDNEPWGRITDGISPPPRFEPFFDGQARIEPLRAGAPRRALAAPLELPGLRRYAYGLGRARAGAVIGQTLGPAIEQAAEQADVVHLWAGNAMTAAVVRAARRTAIPAVTTPFAHRGQWGDDAGTAVAYRAANRVIALLDSEARLYAELGVAGDRLAICGACCPEVPTGAGSGLRRSRGIAGPLVLFLGARRPYKGTGLLIEAASLVVATRPEVTFAFVGPGDALPESDGARLIDAGMVDEDERAAWLDAADLLCLPSDAEIFPTAVLEAWSTGTPVLLSDLEPLIELIELSGGGRITLREPGALADSILGMLADQPRLTALGESGRRFWAEHHTVQAVAQRHELIYREVLHEQGAQRSPSSR